MKHLKHWPGVLVAAAGVGLAILVIVLAGEHFSIAADQFNCRSNSSGGWQKEAVCRLRGNRLRHRHCPPTACSIMSPFASCSVLLWCQTV
jgi:hypothetical protein